MKITLIISVLIGVTSSSCLPGWIPHSSSCYLFSHQPLPWDAAQDFCSEFGGYLIEITSRDENTFVEQIARQIYQSNSTASGHIYGYWTGGREDLQHGYWTWASGDKLTFTDWAPGEPNSRNENCMHINSDESFHWNDYVCTANEYFICEARTSGQGIVG